MCGPKKISEEEICDQKKLKHAFVVSIRNKFDASTECHNNSAQICCHKELCTQKHCTCSTGNRYRSFIVVGMFFFSHFSLLAKCIMFKTRCDYLRNS